MTPAESTVLATFGGGSTVGKAVVATRRGQEFFRRVVLANYDGRCAITGLRHSALLRASHIVSWADAPEHRVSVRNGLALNALHDAAFDNHLIAFDDEQRLLLGKRLRDAVTKNVFSSSFEQFEGQRLLTPARIEPDSALLDRHRAQFLLAEAA